MALPLTPTQVQRLLVQTTARVTHAEQRFAAAITALEVFYTAHSNYRGTVEQQQLEREYRASQRALRTTRTLYSRLAREYRWSLPLVPAAGGPADR